METTPCLGHPLVKPPTPEAKFPHQAAFGPAHAPRCARGWRPWASREGPRAPEIPRYHWPWRWTYPQVMTNIAIECYWTWPFIVSFCTKNGDFPQLCWKMVQVIGSRENFHGSLENAIGFCCLKCLGNRDKPVDIHSGSWRCSSRSVDSYLLGNTAVSSSRKPTHP